MLSRTKLANALIGAGLNPAAAQRYARKIEREQRKPPPLSAETRQILWLAGIGTVLVLGEMAVTIALLLELLSRTPAGG